MQSSKRRSIVIASASFGLTSSAIAQLGGLGGLIGGSKSGGAAGDPIKLEADLKNINITTSLACAAVANALNNREQAARANKNAEDLKSGNTGIADSTDLTSDICKGLAAQMQKEQTEGKKLSADASSSIAKAYIPAILAFPLWKSVADGIKALDKSKSMSGIGLALVRALPKLPTAVISSKDLLVIGIAYLKFSDFDTGQIEQEFAKANT